MYEVTVTKVFAAAHAIRLPDGSHEPLHGHNWQVDVTVTADDLDEIEVVMDFHKLEAIVDDLLGWVRNRNLNDLGPFAEGRVNPTAERVAWWVGTRVALKLPKPVRLRCVTVGEAPGCRATYRPTGTPSESSGAPGESSKG